MSETVAESIGLEGRHAGGPDGTVATKTPGRLIASAITRLRASLVARPHTPAANQAIGVGIAHAVEDLGLQVGSTKGIKADNVVREAAEAARSKGRNARFALRVVAEYRYTCALTGYRCVTDEGAAVVDAAHIEQWARTQNDDLAKGLALSTTPHWMFDEGLWSADNDLRMIVNTRRFSENGPEPLRLSSFAGPAPLPNPHPSRALRRTRQS